MKIHSKSNRSLLSSMTRLRFPSLLLATVACGFLPTSCKRAANAADAA